MAGILHTAYMVCLIVGAFFSVLSVIAGNLLNGFDFDFDLDFDFDFDFDFGALLPVKPFTVMVFVTVFGGCGLILEDRLGSVPCLLLSAAAGFAAAALLYRFVYKKLKSFETNTAKESDALMLRARVVETIPPGGYGKISYVMDGNILSGAARERQPGKGIAKGSDVFILLIRDNVCFVCEDLQITPY